MTPAPTDQSKRGKSGEEDGLPKSAIIALELLITAPVLVVMVYNSLDTIILMMFTILVGFMLWLIRQLC